ncbi:MAG: rubrerythrin family protein [Coriobacteriales bacterium]|jgi:rubrerythrin|nr:rubrerythrin family protein [Coriobacteriales bacterium]
MTDFATSKTKANLEAAFAGESQATNKYAYYADKARKEGYQQIGDIFEETSGNERQHAKIWLQILKSDGAVRGAIPTTTTNLLDAATGENYEWTTMYRDFAAEAREEGFTEIAALFEVVGAIEKDHEERYKQLIERLSKGEVFKRDKVYAWKCLKCGHVHFGTEPPNLCPVCAHPQAYFELRAENY